MYVIRACCIYYQILFFFFFCGVIYQVENVACNIKTMNLLETHVVGLLGEVYTSYTYTSYTTSLTSLDKTSFGLMF